MEMAIRFTWPAGAGMRCVARASVSVARDVFLEGWEILEGSDGELQVRPPTIAVTDGMGRIRLRSALSFEGSQSLERWSEKILSAYRSEAAVPGVTVARPAPARTDSAGPPGGIWEAAFDGGSRGNPGPSGCGAWVRSPDGRCLERGRFLGVTTNNVAEYEGLKLALELVAELAAKGGPGEVVIRGDSKLVIAQVRGDWKVKNAALRPLNREVVRRVRDLGVRVRFEHVPREDNQDADALANEAMDLHSEK